MPINSKTARATIGNFTVIAAYLSRSALNYEYGRTGIRSAGVARHQGALASRVRNASRRSIRPPAAGVSRPLHRSGYSDRRFSHRRRARPDGRADRIRPARLVPWRRPAVSFRERTGADAQHGLALPPADPRLLGRAR